MNHSCRLVSSLEGSLHPASKPWRFATSRGEKYRISPAHSPLNGPASLARPVPTSTSQCSATNASDAVDWAVGTMVWTLFDYYGEPPVGGLEVSSYAFATLSGTVTWDVTAMPEVPSAHSGHDVKVAFSMR